MKKLCFLIAIIILSSCANIGAKFTTIMLESPTDNNALIYFYRPSGYVAGGASFPIIANNMEIGSLDNGAYFKRLIEPGLYKIHSDTGLIDRITNFSFESGKTYFVKTYVDVGVWVSSIRFVSVPKEKAIEEMSQTGIQIENYYGKTVINSVGMPYKSSINSKGS